MPSHSSLDALLPELRETVHLAEGRAGYDVWSCRECGATTGLVVLVPVERAWRHAVHPLCLEHYPADLLGAALCTDAWPGPATPPKYVAEQS